MEKNCDRLVLRLRIFVGAGEVGVETYDKSRVTFGQASDNDVYKDSATLSRHHGEFIRDAKGWSYRDLFSTNGTKVVRNGEEVRLGRNEPSTMCRLEGGEFLKVGRLRLTVEIGERGKLEDGVHTIHSRSSLRKALTMLGVSDGRGALRLLFHSVRRLTAGRSLDDVLDGAAQAAFEGVPALTHVYLLEKDPISDGWKKSWSRTRDGDADSPAFSRTLLEMALEAGESIYYSTLMGDKLDWTKSLEAVGIYWTICVPLSGAQGHLGVLQADCREKDPPLRERDLHFMTLLGEQVAAVADRLRTTRRIEEMFEGFVDASINAIESRDPCTAGHSARVAAYCLDVANAINRADTGPFADVEFSESDLRSLRYAALLHDFGKVGVREQVLTKPHKLSAVQMVRLEGRVKEMKAEAKRHTFGRKAELFEAFIRGGSQGPIPATDALDSELEQELTRIDGDHAWLRSQLGNEAIDPAGAERLARLTEPHHGVSLLTEEEVESLLTCRGTLTRDEWVHMRTHAPQTQRYLERIPWSTDLVRVPEVAGAHHEKLNGVGYPNGKTAAELDLQTRILTVCDMFDALTAADRPYRDLIKMKRALQILREDVRRGEVDGDVLDILQHIAAAQRPTLPGIKALSGGPGVAGSL